MINNDNINFLLEEINKIIDNICQYSVLNEICYDYILIDKIVEELYNISNNIESMEETVIKSKLENIKIKCQKEYDRIV
jgi:hypothetical protein